MQLNLLNIDTNGNITIIDGNGTIVPITKSGKNYIPSVERTATATDYTTNGENLISVTNTLAPRTITLSTADTAISGKIIEILDESSAASTPISQISATLSGSVNISTVHPTYSDVTGLSVTFNTTIANQVVLLTFMGSVSAGGTDVAFIGYKIDGGSDLTAITTMFVSSGYGNASFTMPIVISTAGSHTIQLRAAKSSTNFNIVVDAANIPKLSVVI